MGGRRKTRPYRDLSAGAIVIEAESAIDSGLRARCTRFTQYSNDKLSLDESLTGFLEYLSLLGFR